MKMKTALITGATSGMGKVCAIELANAGYEVIAVARNHDKGNQLLKEIFLINPLAKISLMIADLSVIDETLQLAEKIKSKYGKIDVLINNAGAYFSEYKTSFDGYELTFATNHIPYYLLTKQLLPLLEAAEQARVIFVASEAQKFARPDIKDLQLSRSFKPMRAYANSKLFNIITAFYFAETCKNSNITFNAMHPGGVNTGFAKDAKGITGFIFRVLKFMLRTPEKGAETILWLATSSQAAKYNGKYFFDKEEIKPIQTAYNKDFMHLLITETERLITNANKN